MLTISFTQGHSVSFNVSSEIDKDSYPQRNKNRVVQFYIAHDIQISKDCNNSKSIEA